MRRLLARACAGLVARGQAIEALVGLGLLTAGVGMLSVAAACITAGIVIFGLALWGRRIV